MIMTAKEMSNLAAVNSDVKWIHCSPIMRRIINTARKGRFGVELYWLITDEEKEELIKDGYYVNFDVAKFCYITTW